MELVESGKCNSRPLGKPLWMEQQLGPSIVDSNAMELPIRCSISFGLQKVLNQMKKVREL